MGFMTKQWLTGPDKIQRNFRREFNPVRIRIADTEFGHEWLKENDATVVVEATREDNGDYQYVGFSEGDLTELASVLAKSPDIAKKFALTVLVGRTDSELIDFLARLFSETVPRTREIADRRAEMEDLRALAAKRIAEGGNR